MRDLFLGKPLHWLLIIAVVVLTWWTGGAKLHVIHFNAFIITIVVVALALVVAVIRTTAPGEQVTRDILPSREEMEADDVEKIRDPEAGA